MASDPTPEQVRLTALYGLLYMLANGRTTKDRIDAMRELEKWGYDFSNLSDAGVCKPAKSPRASDGGSTEFETEG
jgi:hypothetical protein